MRGFVIIPASLERDEPARRTINKTSLNIQSLRDGVMDLGRGDTPPSVVEHPRLSPERQSLAAL